MKIKTAMTGLALCTGVMASGQAIADTTGSLNITSDYVFRGMDLSEGAAVQGSLDWSSASGLYAGVWGSNDSGTGSEVDVYAGWATELGSGLGFDVGVVYYGYPEGSGGSMAEVYVGLSMGGLSGAVYYSDDVAGSDESGTYVSLAYSHGLSDTVDLTLQAGQTDVDTVGKYEDYSLSLSKDMGNGWGSSFAFIDTSDDAGVSDKFVVSVSREFEL